MERKTLGEIHPKRQNELKTLVQWLGDICNVISREYYMYRIRSAVR